MISAGQTVTWLGSILLGIALAAPHALAADVMSETRIESTSPSAKTESAVPSTREDLATRYQLGTGDVISIRVFDEPDLSFDRIRLSDAATVPFPLLGEIQARGRTPVELEARVREALSDGFLVEPRVTVSVVQYRQFYVTGEVASPGGFAFQPGITVRKALALAGDTTDRASEQKMFIIRDTRPEDVLEADLAERRQRVGMNDLLLPGDTLLIEASFF